MSESRFYRRKRPAVVEAQRWDGTPAEATRIVDWILDHGEDAVLVVGTTPVIVMESSTTITAAAAGDWIVRGPLGDFSACKPPMFALHYEAVRSS